METFTTTFVTSTSIVADGDGNTVRKFKSGDSSVSIPLMRNGKPVTWFDDSKLIKPEYRK